MLKVAAMEALGLTFWDRAKAVTLICRETVEQPHAAGALKPILAAVARWV